MFLPAHRVKDFLDPPPPPKSNADLLFELGHTLKFKIRRDAAGKSQRDDDGHIVVDFKLSGSFGVKDSVEAKRAA